MQVASSNQSSFAPASADQAHAGDYTVRRGDTLSAIARRFGTSVEALVAANGIRNSDFIRTGPQLAIPDGAMRSVSVVRGDTLSGIAARNGVSLAGLIAANPQIRNTNLIHPGDRIAIPDARPQAPATAPRPVARPGGVEAVGETRMADGTLALSRADVLNIKKTLQTEWVQSAGEGQARGIVDTILNRTASGHWGNTVAEVVNAPYQFSDINGPVAWDRGRSSVEAIPASSVSARVDAFVDAYLAERAAGAPSSVGSHLNYANPHYSSPRNLGWIMALDGPVLGSGPAIHRHGTTPDFERHRPGAFALALPGGATAASAAPDAATPPALPGSPFDARAFAAANGVGVKSASVGLSRLDPTMAPVIAAVASEAARLGLPAPVITSGTDGRHRQDSLHYSGMALDFRGRNITIEQGYALRDAVQRALGSDYDVLFETFADRKNNHLHVEFDPD